MSAGRDGGGLPAYTGPASIAAATAGLLVGMGLRFSAASLNVGAYAAAADLAAAEEFHYAARHAYTADLRALRAAPGRDGTDPWPDGAQAYVVGDAFRIVVPIDPGGAVPPETRREACSAAGEIADAPLPPCRRLVYEPSRGLRLAR